MGGLPRKKWYKSKANQYISRRKACAKLQISLHTFRRLCILKGIYPHDPKKKHKREGNRRIYYHVSDIKNLWREPILWKWRERHTFEKKMIRAKGSHQWQKVRGMAMAIPQISIDHLVRERYPTFSEALRDLDDCLSFIFLFASMPSGIVPELTALRRMECQRLVREFKHYVAMHGQLIKGFISVKGYYYQIRMQGKFTITWVAPHHFGHEIPKGVDFKVMSTFLNFYQCMLKFVLVRLYRTSNMVYPPFGDLEYAETALSLTELRTNAFRTKKKLKWNNHLFKKKKKQKWNSNDSEGAQSAVNQNGDGDPQNDGDGDHEGSRPRKVVQLDLSKILGDTNTKDNEGEDQTVGDDHDGDDNQSESEGEDKPDLTLRSKDEIQTRTRRNLFKGFKFLLNTETPQQELEFVVLSMGGSVVLQQSVNRHEQKCTSITHQIVDRDLHSSQLLNYRQYIQPQWVFDCLNTGVIVPTEHYQIGVQCPPHLSPFVSYDDRSHKPSQAFVLEHWKEMASQFGGFVPSKMLKPKKEKEEESVNTESPKDKDTKQEKEEEDEDEDGEEEDIGMDLNIDDIMDFDLKNEEKKEGVAEEEEVDDFQMSDEEEQKEIEQMEKELEQKEQAAIEEDDEEVDEEDDGDDADDDDDGALSPEKRAEIMRKEREEKAEMKSKKYEELRRHRLQIAMKKRKKREREKKMKGPQHGLTVDGMPVTGLEEQKMHLAQTFMSKNDRKWYDKVMANKRRKNWKVQKLELTQMMLEDDPRRFRVLENMRKKRGNGRKGKKGRRKRG